MGPQIVEEFGFENIINRFLDLLPSVLLCISLPRRHFGQSTSPFNMQDGVTVLAYFLSESPKASSILVDFLVEKQRSACPLWLRRRGLRMLDEKYGRVKGEA